MLLDEFDPSKTAVINPWDLIIFNLAWAWLSGIRAASSL